MYSGARANPTTNCRPSASASCRIPSSKVRPCKENRCSRADSDNVPSAIVIGLRHRITKGRGEVTSKRIVFVSTYRTPNL